MTDEVRAVALLALAYRDCVRAGYRNPDEVLDDFGTCSGELTLAVLHCTHNFTEADWQILDRLSHRNGDAREPYLLVVRSLVADEPLRAEALLHARGHPSGRGWARDIVRRWGPVQVAMDALAQEGMAVPFGELELIAGRVFAAVTGGNPLDWDEQFERV